MMYDQKMVLAVKSGGKILREFKDTVLLPFSSEYSLLIKNLNTARAVVHVYIDGEDQTPNGLVIDAGRECNFERSLKNGNLTEGNKFKFIARTDSVEQHRGIKLEDGIVRIEFQFESQYQHAQKFTPAWPGTVNYHSQQGTGYSHTALRGFSGSINQDSGAFVCQSAATPVKPLTMGDTQAYNDAGITVAGSKSTQHFSTTTMGLMEFEKYTIVLKILGETPDNKPVLDPVTVSSKNKCNTCGTVSKSSAQFCSNCGTALTIY